MSTNHIYKYAETIVCGCVHLNCLS